MSEGLESKYSHLPACRDTRLLNQWISEDSKRPPSPSILSNISNGIQKVAASIAIVPSAVGCSAQIIMDKLSLLPHRPTAGPSGAMPAEIETPAP